MFISGFYKTQKALKDMNDYAECIEDVHVVYIFPYEDPLGNLLCFCLVDHETEAYIRRIYGTNNLLYIRMKPFYNGLQMPYQILGGSDLFLTTCRPAKMINLEDPQKRT